MRISFLFLFPSFLLIFITGCLKKKCDDISPLVNPPTVTKLTLQPDGTSGIDTYIASSSPTVNYASDSKIYSEGWTYGGGSLSIYFLIKFDYSSIPTNAKIKSAKLSLYADTTNVFSGSPAPDRGHYGGGADSTCIKRIISSWNESSVSWNTKPSSSTDNIVKLSPTTSFSQAFTNIDVTNIVIDQIQMGNYGFEFSLIDFTPYKRVIFYSSNGPYSTLRPKLEVQY